MKQRMTFAARIYKDEIGYIAEFPQLDLITQGADLDEALEMAIDALETYFLDFAHDEVAPPASNLAIDLEEDDLYAVISVQVDSMEDYVLTTKQVMQQLNINKQRVAQLRNSGQLAARQVGRDYFHSQASVDTIAHVDRRAGRPPKAAAA